MMVDFWFWPSTKTLIAWAGWPPAEMVRSLSPSATRTPGARAAKLRKLRLICGRLLIWCWLTPVATSEVRTSKMRRPVTTTSSTEDASAEPPVTMALPTSRSRVPTWPVVRVTVSVAVWPSALATSIR